MRDLQYVMRSEEERRASRVYFSATYHKIPELGGVGHGKGDEQCKDDTEYHIHYEDAVQHQVHHPVLQPILLRCISFGHYDLRFSSCIHNHSQHPYLQQNVNAEDQSKAAAEDESTEQRKAQSQKHSPILFTLHSLFILKRIRRCNTLTFRIPQNRPP